MINLGTTYCEEDHGVELKDLIQSNEDILSKDSFIDWYIRWVFKQDDDLGDDNPEAEINNETDIPKSSGWSGVSWSVKPSLEAVNGETWKCLKCRIINPWSEGKCLACDSDAPHASTLVPKVVTSTVFGFGSSSSNTIPQPSGFSFSGAPLAGSSSTSTFSFTNAPIASNHSSIVTGGFSFVTESSKSDTEGSK
jgi:hypothetical protein